MARYRERRVRLSSSSPTFDVFPLLALPMLYFNFMVFIVIGLDQAAVNAWLAGPAFQLTMFSGAVWSMTQADVIIAAGMGLLFIQSVQNADIPVMSAYLLLVAFIFVTINFVVDLLYVYVDPRIRIVARET